MSIARRFYLRLREGFLIPATADKKEGDIQEHPYVMSHENRKVLYISLLEDGTGSESRSWQGTELTKHFWGRVGYLHCDWQAWPCRAAAKPSQPKDRL